MEDLIRLELFKYNDDVQELVDAAALESKIENKINIISHTWDDYDFIFLDYKDTNIIGPLDEIVENVETQSLDLMTMMASKYVEEFKETVTKW